VPLGEYAELKPTGHTKTGTENFGGRRSPLADWFFVQVRGMKKSGPSTRIPEKNSGRQNCRGAAMHADGLRDQRTRVRRDRRDGRRKMGTTTGDAYVAFALPKP